MDNEDFPIKKIKKAVIVTLTKGSVRWIVKVFALQFREPDIWARVKHPSDPGLQDTWVNLSDYTTVNGGGQVFTGAKVAVLQMANEAQPKQTPDESEAAAVARLQKLWGVKS